MTATAAPTCHVVISLAHLLQQHSLSYDDEKNALLDASVKTVVTLSKLTSAATAPANDGDNEATSTHPPEGEVHVVLTGSPRPTFAETNAWLLEDHGSPRGQRTSVDHSPRKSSLDEGASNRHREDHRVETNLDDDDGRTANLPMPMELDQVPNATLLPQRQRQPPHQEEQTPSTLMHDYIHESTPHSSTQNANMNDLCGSPTKTGGSVLTHFQNRKRASTADSVSDAVVHGGFGDGETAAGGVAPPAATGPMVGHAVVNAISQTQGLGLHSSRSRLLQGTIDRPLWDQRRWTDGECLFSELVDRVGLESFENVGVVGGRGRLGGSAAGGGGADDAAGGGGMGSVRRHVSTLGEVGHDLDKTTNVSAHLITVPAVVNGPVQWNSSGSGSGSGSEREVEIPGMDESTMEEIARGILRCLKRKKSPPVTKVYLVLPPLFPNINATDSSTAMEVEGADIDRARRELAVKRFSEAWEKLEQYNDMIGQPKLMAGVDMEFVRVGF